VIYPIYADLCLVVLLIGSWIWLRREPLHHDERQMCVRKENSSTHCDYAYGLSSRGMHVSIQDYPQFYNEGYTLPANSWPMRRSSSPNLLQSKLLLNSLEMNRPRIQHHIKSKTGPHLPTPLLRQTPNPKFPAPTNKLLQNPT